MYGMIVGRCPAKTPRTDDASSATLYLLMPPVLTHTPYCLQALSVYRHVHSIVRQVRSAALCTTAVQSDSTLQTVQAAAQITDYCYKSTARHHV
jgi:hypothetical protein